MFLEDIMNEWGYSGIWYDETLHIYYIFKGTPWDGTNWGFLFCVKQCIPHIMILFQNFQI